MSKVKIQGNASGTGVVTLTAPNTNTDRTITLPDAEGTLVANTSTGVDVTGSVTADGAVNSTYFIGGSSSVAGRQLTLSCEDGTGGNDNATHRLTVPSGYGSFATNVGGSERMRIDSSGNVMVGTTAHQASASTGDGGAWIGSPTGIHVIAKNSAVVQYLNRIGTDGTITEFRKNGNNVGSIGTVSNWLTLTNQYGRQLSLIGNTTPRISPSQDNYWDVGNSSFRFDDIYATNGTIQTSDRNEKQDIEELSEAEQRVAVACKGLLRKFRWQDSVAEKGDDARIHFGIIAQDLQDAFAAEGLDAGDYAMFISSTWYEKEVEVPAVEAVEAVEATYDDEGAELTPAVEAVEAKDSYTRTDTEDEPTDGYTERTRLGVRYPELLAFIISAI
jgi:hypothetical protein